MTVKMLVGPFAVAAVFWSVTCLNLAGFPQCGSEFINIHTPVRIQLLPSTIHTACQD